MHCKIYNIITIDQGYYDRSSAQLLILGYIFTAVPICNLQNYYSYNKIGSGYLMICEEKLLL